MTTLFNEWVYGTEIPRYEFKYEISTGIWRCCPLPGTRVEELRRGVKRARTGSRQRPLRITRLMTLPIPLNDLVATGKVSTFRQLAAACPSDGWRYGRGVGMNLAISPIVVAVTVIVAVCLIAGYIPTRRALKIDPVQALRYE